MDFKQIFNIVIIILLIILASYLFTNKSAKNGEVCPAAPAIQPNTQKYAQVTQILTKENTSGIKVTFVELGSVGCGPCDAMRPILDEIEKEYDGQVMVRFWDVKTLFGRPYAEKYKIRLIPTQVFLDKDGNEYYRHVGFFPKEEIIKILQLKGVQ